MFLTSLLLFFPQVFVKGGAALDLNNVQPKPCKWILDMTWLNLVELSSRLREFRDLLNQVSMTALVLFNKVLIKYDNSDIITYQQDIAVCRITKYCIISG